MFKEEFEALCNKAYDLIESGMTPTAVFVKGQAVGISRTELRRALWHLANTGRIKLAHDFTITKLRQ